MRRRNRIRRRKLLRIFFLLIITIGLCTVIHWVWKVNSQKTPKAVASAEPTPALTTEDSLHNSQALHIALQNELQGTSGIYGIIYMNFKTGETYFEQENRVFKSASLYKLWIMATTYEQIREGKLREEETLSEEAITLYEKFKLATDSAELKDKKITFSVKDALERMITISDNDAALLLAAKVRLSNVTAFLKQHGFTKSKVGVSDGYPLTTPLEVALFFKKLYKGELTTREYTEKMLSLLKRQRLNEKLPKYLPEEIKVAHKTGELHEFTHDAGIVYTPQGDYIITVLTKSDFPPEAKNRVAGISKAVYTYFITSQDLSE